MTTYVRVMRLVGWVTIIMVPVVVLVGNWITATMNPNACPIGLVCQN